MRGQFGRLLHRVKILGTDSRARHRAGDSVAVRSCGGRMVYHAPPFRTIGVWMHDAV